MSLMLGTQDKDFFPTDIVEKLKFIKEIGFECFEIDGKLLVENVDLVKKAIKETGVIVPTACGGYSGWIGDFNEEKRINGVKEIAEILRCIKEIGGTGVVVPAAWGMFTFRLPPMVSPRSLEEDKATIIKSLKELDVVANELGVYLYLEPLNRYQDHMLNRTEDAFNIIKEGKFTNVKITCDFYHMSIEEDDISETLVQFKDYVGHIHIAENHRYEPGTGSIDFKRHINTLKDIGYNGPVVNEGRIKAGDQLERYKKSITYMKQFM